MKVYESLENNSAKIERVFGRRFVEDSTKDILDPGRFYKNNEKLARLVYGEEIARAIKNCDIKELTRIYNSINDVKQRNGLSGKIDFNSIGIVLVRPETYGACEKYRKFIKSLGLTIIYERDIYVNMEQYLSLYYDGICFGLSHLDDVRNLYFNIKLLISSSVYSKLL